MDIHIHGMFGCACVRVCGNIMFLNTDMQSLTFVLSVPIRRSVGWSVYVLDL